MTTKIFRLTEQDPAYHAGARYAVCKPAWAEWTNEDGTQPLVSLAYLKCETLEDARRFAEADSSLYSTMPSGVMIDQTQIIK